jgi:hypothetical protein
MTPANDRRGRLAAEPFGFRISADGRVHMSWHGRVVKVVAGVAAAKLSASLAASDPRNRQLLLAKASGNFKRGNEA